KISLGRKRFALDRNLSQIVTVSLWTVWTQVNLLLASVFSCVHTTVRSLSGNWTRVIPRSRRNLSRMMKGNKRELISAWKQSRAAGRSQRDFCMEHGISDRTLRGWLAADEPRPVSVRQAATVLRRLGRHLLQVADALSNGDEESPLPEQSNQDTAVLAGVQSE